MVDQEYNKFEYRDLNKEGFFVQSSSQQTLPKEDKIINEAVSEHFSHNLSQHEDSSMWTDIKTHKIVDEKIPDVELNEIKTHSFTEDGEQGFGEISTTKTKVSEPPIDVEKIKEESYQKGYREAESLLTPKLAEKASDDAFRKQLQEKLSGIEPKLDLKDGAFEMGVGLITILAKKLHLAVPADFEAIMLGEMMPIVSKYYKKGKVIAKVNPERVDYCNNLFKIGELPESLAENIELVPDEQVAKDGCSMEWQDAVLEYNQEDLLTEVDKILDHLKMKIGN